MGRVGVSSYLLVSSWQVSRLVPRRPRPSHNYHHHRNSELIKWRSSSTRVLALLITSTRTINPGKAKTKLGSCLRQSVDPAQKPRNLGWPFPRNRFLPYTTGMPSNSLITFLHISHHYRRLLWFLVNTCPLIRYRVFGTSILRAESPNLRKLKLDMSRVPFCCRNLGDGCCWNKHVCHKKLLVCLFFSFFSISVFTVRVSWGREGFSRSSWGREVTRPCMCRSDRKSVETRGWGVDMRAGVGNSPLVY